MRYLHRIVPLCLVAVILFALGSAPAYADTAYTDPVGIFTASLHSQYVSYQGNPVSASNYPNLNVSDIYNTAYTPLVFTGRGAYNVVNYSMSGSLDNGVSNILLYLAYTDESQADQVTVRVNVPGIGRYSYSGVLDTFVSSPYQVPNLFDFVSVVTLDFEQSSSPNNIQFQINSPSGTDVCLYGVQFLYESDSGSLPETHGSVYDFTVDPSVTTLHDVRDYAAAFYRNCLENSYWPAVYYPYYTIGSWIVNNDKLYIVMSFSQEPIISQVSARNLTFGSNNEFVPTGSSISTSTLSTNVSTVQSSMTYVGVFKGFNRPITFYYTNYYIPSWDLNLMWTFTGSPLGVPYALPWVGYGYDDLKIDTRSTPTLFCRRSDSEGGFVSDYYYLITNYSVQLDAPTHMLEFSEHYISSTSSIPSSYMSLYNVWKDLGNDRNGEFLASILNKVTSIDNRISDILEDQGQIDSSFADAGSAAEGAASAITDAESDIYDAFGESNTYELDSSGLAQNVALGSAGFGLINEVINDVSVNIPWYFILIGIFLAMLLIKRTIL